MSIQIKRLRIVNFKSIQDLVLTDLPSFAVFAGANGSGKTNLFEALHFVSLFVRFGLPSALKEYGGFENIFNYSNSIEEQSFIFEMELHASDVNSEWFDESVGFLKKELFKEFPIIEEYSLTIRSKDSANNINESVIYHNSFELKRNGCSFLFNPTKPGIFDGSDKILVGSVNLPSPVLELLSLHEDISVYLALNNSPIKKLLTNLRFHQIDPSLSRMPSPGSNASELSKNGRNLAAVLHRLKKNEEIRVEILDWMKLLVPGLKEVTTREHNRNQELVFQENHLEEKLPAHLVSDGTAYILGLLVAIYSQREHGITLIEEPERGIHPHVIMELIGFMREEAAQTNRLIWITTHSATVVRLLQDGELWLVDKVNRRDRNDVETRIKPARQLVTKMMKDEAWLCNFFGAGLP